MPIEGGVVHDNKNFMLDFRFGSKADIGACPRDVRFTPKSGHWRGYSITSSAVASSDCGMFQTERFGAADRPQHRRAAGAVSGSACASGTAQKPSSFSERKISSRHILILVSGASRCWYAAMRADEQNCMCQ